MGMGIFSSSDELGFSFGRDVRAARMRMRMRMKMMMMMMMIMMMMTTNET